MPGHNDRRPDGARGPAREEVAEGGLKAISLSRAGLMERERMDVFFSSGGKSISTAMEKVRRCCHHPPGQGQRSSSGGRASGPTKELKE